MATETIQISGLGQWINILDEKFLPKKRKTKIYPDKASLKKIKDSGLKLKAKEDEDGVYYNFNRKDEDGPPFVFLKGSTDSFEDKIGNDSVITLKVEVYDTKSFGKGHRVEAIRVDALVPYVSAEGSAEPGAPRKKPMPF